MLMMLQNVESMKYIKIENTLTFITLWCRQDSAVFFLHFFDICLDLIYHVPYLLHLKDKKSSSVCDIAYMIHIQGGLQFWGTDP